MRCFSLKMPDERQVWWGRYKSQERSMKKLFWPPWMRRGVFEKKWNFGFLLCNFCKNYNGSGRLHMALCRRMMGRNRLCHKEKSGAFVWLVWYNKGVKRQKRWVCRTAWWLLADKGALVMTGIFIFAALSVASIVYTVVDNYSMETERQIDDFYRVENKKACIAHNGWN